MDVTDFIEELREVHRFSIGVEQHLAVQILLDRFAYRTGPPSKQQLKGLLSPIVCSTAEEQRKFYTLFDQWISTHDYDAASEAAARTSDRQQKPDVERAISRVGFLDRAQTVLFGLIALAVLVVGISIFPEGGSDGGTDGVDGPGPNGGGDVIDPYEVPTSNLLNWSSTSILFALLVCGVLVVYNRSQQRWLINASTGERVEFHRLDLKRLHDLILSRAAFAAAGRRLRDHRTVALDILDPTATAKATAENLGRITLKYSRRVAQPEYLCLVDQRNSLDHLSRFALELIRRTAINARVYVFHGSPTECERHNRLGTRTSLRQLAAAYRNHRLLVFADADIFYDRYTQLEGWLPEFDAWPDRVLITPSEPAEWARRERGAAATGFTVVPADPAALQVLHFSDELDSEVEVVESLPSANQFVHFPPLLRGNETRWREGIHPGSDTVNRLMDELVLFLGPNGFSWMAACSVFPTVHYALTLFLGAGLFDVDGKPIGNRGLLARLMRLPWFRYGSMPSWLKTRLKSEMTPMYTRQVKELVYEWLGNNLAKSIPSGETLNVASPRTRRSLVRQWLKNQPDDVQEHLLYGFLSDSMQRRIALAIPRKIQSLFGDVASARGKVFWKIMLPVAVFIIASPLLYFAFEPMSRVAISIGTASGEMPDFFLSTLTKFAIAVGLLSAVSWFFSVLGNYEYTDDPRSLPTAYRFLRFRQAIGRSLVAIYPTFIRALIATLLLLSAAFIVSRPTPAPSIGFVLAYCTSLLVLFAHAVTRDYQKTCVFRYTEHQRATSGTSIVFALAVLAAFVYTADGVAVVWSSVLAGSE